MLDLMVREAVSIYGERKGVCDPYLAVELSHDSDEYLGFVCVWVGWVLLMCK